MAEAPPTKICTGCGMDVASVKRFKDLEGNYYCEPCWNTHTAKLEEDKRARRAAARAKQAADAPTTTTVVETEPEQDVETGGEEEAPTDPLLAAIAGAAASPRPEIEKNPDGTDKPIPPPRRHKGPGKWVLWVMILVGVTLLFACAMVAVLIIKGPEKTPTKPAPATSLPVVQSIHLT